MSLEGISIKFPSQPKANDFSPARKKTYRFIYRSNVGAKIIRLRFTYNHTFVAHIGTSGTLLFQELPVIRRQNGELSILLQRTVRFAATRTRVHFMAFVLPQALHDLLHNFRWGYIWRSFRKYRKKDISSWN